MNSVNLPTKYDTLIDRHRGAIPLQYMRALIWRESRMDPDRVNPSSNATGLTQITRIALADYNDHHDSDLSLSDMRDPENAIEVGAWLLNRIRRNWDQTRVAELHTDWSDPDYVRLLTAGWNSGWVGVRRRAQELHDAGREVSHASVMDRWRQNNKTLASRHRERWQQSVADLYFELLDDPAAPNSENSDKLVKRKKVGTVAKATGVGLGFGFFVWLISRFWGE